MSNLICCTITGADDGVSHYELLRLSQKYPFVEWGILYTPKETRQGTSRYPSNDWLLTFFRMCLKHKFNRSIHLCGKAVDMFAENDNSILMKLLFFQRVQLNFSLAKTNGDVLSKIALIGKSLPIEVITQEHEGNCGVSDYMRENYACNDAKRFGAAHSVLFDSSGGNGISREDWLLPINGILCGYAGGLNPNNLEDNILKIVDVVGRKNFWIDMESGVRNDDGTFSIEKTEKCLKVVESLIKKKVISFYGQ